MTELFMQQSTAPGRETTTTAPAQPAAPGGPPRPKAAAKRRAWLDDAAPVRGADPPRLPHVAQSVEEAEAGRGEHQDRRSRRHPLGMIGRVIDVGDRTTKLEIAPASPSRC